MATVNTATEAVSEVPDRLQSALVVAQVLLGIACFASAILIAFVLPAGPIMPFIAWSMVGIGACFLVLAGGFAQIKDFAEHDTDAHTDIDVTECLPGMKHMIVRDGCNDLSCKHCGKPFT